MMIIVMCQEYNEEYENQVINEEYKIWKKNAPFLYDLVISHELEWPSLSVQWMPKKEQPANADYSIHKLIIGTNTSEKEPNYLMIGKVRLPKDDLTQADLIEYQQNNKDVGGIGLATGENRIEIETKILHEGEVNRARYMPQKINVIASKTVSGEVHIFDYSQHPSTPENDGIVKPQLRLVGHSKEGYGLSWNEKKPGYIISGDYEGKILLWNVEAQTEKNASVQPLSEFGVGNRQPIEDVCWHKFHQEIFGSCGDDRCVNIWDCRKPHEPITKILAHTSEIYTMDFNHFNEYLFLTGSEDKTINLFDLRNTARPLHSFLSHNDQILQVQWSPDNMSTFASCSADRRCMVWDFSRCGQPQSEQDEKDGPPELLFIHGGHRAKVCDLSWNLNEQFVLASVEDNNILQVWQIAQHVYAEDDQ